MSTIIQVRVRNRLGPEFSYACEVSDVYREVFEPLRTTDCASLAFALGALRADSMGARKAVRRREDAAKDIADKITEALIRAMKQYDTHNGYPIEEKQQ